MQDHRKDPLKFMAVRVPQSLRDQMNSLCRQHGLRLFDFRRAAWRGAVAMAHTEGPPPTPETPRMRVTIESKRCLSQAQLDQCTNGQQIWWLRSHWGFVPLDSAEVQGQERRYGHGLRPDYWGTAPVRITIDLPPGEYTLGCGPRPPVGVRQHVLIDEHGLVEPVR